jgi:hypothetical protein
MDRRVGGVCVGSVQAAHARGPSLSMAPRRSTLDHLHVSAEIWCRTQCHARDAHWHRTALVRRSCRPVRVCVRAHYHHSSRNFLIVNAAARRYMTARQCGRMILIQLKRDKQTITLSLDDGNDVLVNLDDVVADGDIHTCL